ncbi:uncharacterized protein SEPMUDRAFT_131808 [Sphaerulina musiva SO2202]|uniref:Uncharacterized protein n=1 Tax=Sphaerulina musiva (strain SO2202) TaxID=692275 RepID=M3C192_SPHMS|nr:uncharacterized protein SEPMUDRAFT_131808 [Sphaerulina musiva SO2202]EMF14066.1 hypothetical protein SEPMUDRAFT_131808 [Sphaerulina musiva SO2202]
MGKGKGRSRHSTNNNNNNKNNKSQHPPSSSNSNSTISPPPTTTTTTTTTPPSRLRLLPRELRDKIYESICLAPNDSTFTMPSPSSICGLGRQMGAELMETFHREILARNEAEIILLPRTRKYHISWSFDTTLPPDAEPCVHITLPVQVWREGPCRVAPDTIGNGEGPDSTKASIWREPDKTREIGSAEEKEICSRIEEFAGGFQ